MSKKNIKKTLTVEELISKLNGIEDKKLEIYMPVGRKLYTVEDVISLDFLEDMDAFSTKIKKVVFLK